MPKKWKPEAKTNKSGHVSDEKAPKDKKKFGKDPYKKMNVVKKKK